MGLAYVVFHKTVMKSFRMGIYALHIIAHTHTYAYILLCTNNTDGALGGKWRMPAKRKERKIKTNTGQLLIKTRRERGQDRKRVS